MKKHVFQFVSVIVIAIFTQTTYSQDGFPYHLYKTRTLAEFEKIHSSVKEIEYEDHKQIMITAKSFYSAIRVQYTSKSRKITKERLALIKMWQESLGINKNVLDLLDKEYLFKECGQEYWISVQKQVAAYFAKELENEDMITLYLMAVGGVRPGDKWEFIFLVNEFQKY